MNTVERQHAMQPGPAAGERHRPDRPGGRGRLEMREVWREFASHKTPALENINLTIQPGEFVVVVGPSGCGKTTLLNLVGGLDSPSRGQVLIDGKSVLDPGPDRAMVFQEHGLFPWLTAAENVEIGLRIRGLSRRERRDRAADALKMLHLSNAGHKLCHELSGGMKQRVAIARALVMDPAMLLMDEPFSALDAQTRTLLHEQMQDIWSQTHTTVLFVTHSVGEAVRLADRVIILHTSPGRIRREVRVDIPHPRDFDSSEISEVVGLIRTEIEDEVTRVNAAMA